MIARVLRAQLPANQIDEFVRRYRDDVRPIHEKAAGLHGHYVLVNREAGDLTIVGVWDSEDALRAVASELEPARSQLWSGFAPEPRLTVYEVADWLDPSPGNVVGR
jgi:heme-degrading monooxygenase HmoA